VAAEAISNSPGSSADLTSEGEGRIVAHTGKLQGEEYLEDKEGYETGRDSVEVDGYYYATSDYFGEQWVALIVRHRQPTADTPTVVDDTNSTSSMKSRRCQLQIIYPTSRASTSFRVQHNRLAV